MPITRTLTPPTMPICPRTFAKLGADSIGKLDVTIENQHQQGGVTMYSIRVAGPTGSHVVERRYKDVEKLRHMMLAQTPQAQVVQMPPKSFFRKNFSRNFMEERKRLLGEVVVACTAAADRYTDSCPPILYEFLGFSDFDDSAMETPSRATETDAMNVADIGEVQVSPRGSPTNTTEAEARASNSKLMPTLFCLHFFTKTWSQKYVMQHVSACVHSRTFATSVYMFCFCKNK